MLTNYEKKNMVVPNLIPHYMLYNCKLRSFLGGYWGIVLRWGYLMLSGTSIVNEVSKYHNN